MENPRSVGVGPWRRTKQKQYMQALKVISPKDFQFPKSLPLILESKYFVIQGLFPLVKRRYTFAPEVRSQKQRFWRGDALCFGDLRLNLSLSCIASRQRRPNHKKKMFGISIPRYMHLDTEEAPPSFTSACFP